MATVVMTVQLWTLITTQQDYAAERVCAYRNSEQYHLGASNRDLTFQKNWELKKKQKNNIQCMKCKYVSQNDAISESGIQF